jgi:peptidyl-prolyl cis-trans isomerase D
MLDLFRRRKGGLKWVLWLVILVLGAGMLLFFVQTPGGMGVGLGSQNVAVVAGNSINVNQYRRLYNQIFDSYRQMYPIDQGNVEMLRQLGLADQALDQLISEYAIGYGAQSMGIEATREEVAKYITTLPLFQEDGRFIGTERYMQILQANNLAAAEYEDGIRREIVRTKLLNVVTDGIRATDEEVRQEFLNRNQGVKIRYVAIDPREVAPETVDEEALKTYFEEQKENYRTPEQRKVEYIIFSVQPEEVDLTEEQIQERMASIPEKREVRASHILLTLDDENAQQKGEELLEQLRAGADFAELAKEHTRDEASAASGGDVGFFGRGAMVPEFEAAAFSLEPGEISDLVATQYGFHIIKVTDINRVDSRALAEAELRQAEGEILARSLAQKVAHEAREGAGLETAAERYSLEIQETPFFTLGDVIPDLNVRNDFNQQIFALSPGQATEAYDRGGTYLVAQLLEVQETQLSEFEAVEGQVSRDFKASRGEEIARERAFAFTQALQEEPDFETVAGQENLNITTTEFFQRNTAVDDELGSAAEILNRAFVMTENESSPALSVSGKYVVFQVTEKSEVDEEQFEKERDGLALQMTDEKRSRFFVSWVQNVVDSLYEENRIEINRLLVDSIVG